MSGGKRCFCEESNKPILKRQWEIERMKAELAGLERTLFIFFFSVGNQAIIN